MRSFGWKIFLQAPIEKVFAALSTDEGRETFWAEKTIERDGSIDFVFPNGETYKAEILAKTAPVQLSIRYFDAVTTFDLEAAADGTTLALNVSEAPEDDWLESYAGWVSVLMNMKAVLDFGADLRNHDPAKSWGQRFVDN